MGGAVRVVAGTLSRDAASDPVAARRSRGVPITPALADVLHL
ncbi:MAG: hypothetical protein ACRDU4_20615 [Mycobacterium sp.]